MSGQVLEAEESKFPSSKYWQSFVDSTSGQHINFSEVASLAEFSCPDGSHLDGKARAPFTSALAAELQNLLNHLGR